MTFRAFRNLGAPVTASAALLLTMGVYAQTAPGGGTQPGSPTSSTEATSPAGQQPASPSAAQPSTPAGTQPPAPAGAQTLSGADSPSTQTTQPAYPSTDPPRGMTPAQRQQQQQQQLNAVGAQTGTATCAQTDELARSECLRRDMTDDEDRPAGVTRSMQQRRQQAQQQQQESESTNVASEADSGSDQARRRTRTASSDLPSAERTETETQETNPPQPSDAEADNASDTLGSER